MQEECRLGRSGPGIYRPIWIFYIRIRPEVQAAATRITCIFRGCADKRPSIGYISRMAEKASVRCAQGLRGSGIPPMGVEQQLPAVPGVLRVNAAFDVAAAIAGRRPSWAVVSALATVAALIAATLVLVLRLSGAPRESGFATADSLPLPTEALPANSAASSEVAAPAANAPPQNPRPAPEWHLARSTDGDPTPQDAIAVRYAEARV